MGFLLANRILSLRWVYMGVSENRGPYYSTLNSRIFIIRTPNKVPQIFGNSYIAGLRVRVLGPRHVGVDGLRRKLGTCSSQVSKILGFANVT